MSSESGLSNAASWREVHCIYENSQEKNIEFTKPDNRQFGIFDNEPDTFIRPECFINICNPAKQRVNFGYNIFGSTRLRTSSNSGQRENNELHHYKNLGLKQNEHEIVREIIVDRKEVPRAHNYDHARYR